MRKPNQGNSDFYVVGGTMRPDAPSYIERNADNELYERALAGEFCYVLTPRQMGKSSLMARTADRLKKDGIHTAVVDLSGIGAEKEERSAGRWYYGIAHRIVQELNVKMKLSDWWKEREKLPALQRLTEFFEDMILENTNKRVVIFLDEIDTTITLPFTDDFFAAIRACYNARATQPEFGRLSFVLLGVATPSQLIKDTRRTPFNIGHRIELTDFTLEEARPLAHHLCKDRIRGESMLKRILYWSGGHPYLTQKLCCLIADEKEETYSDGFIDSLVEKDLLEPKAIDKDSNLHFINNRVVQSSKNKKKIVKLYRNIYQGDPIIDEPLSLTHTALKLTGLIIVGKDRQLRVHNRIYERVFKMEWVRDAMPDRWERNTFIVPYTILLLMFFIVYFLYLPFIHINDIQSTGDNVPYSSYESLKKIIGYGRIADRYLAVYWDQRALRKETQGHWKESLLYRLKGLKIEDEEERRKEIGRLISGPSENFVDLYQHDELFNYIVFSLFEGSENKIGNLRFLWLNMKQPGENIIKGEQEVTAVALNSDGNALVTGNKSGAVRMWEIKSGKLLGDPIDQKSEISAVKLSAASNTLVTSNKNGEIRLFKINTGRPLGRPIKQESEVTAFALIPDGDTLITGNKRGEIRLIEINTGQPLRELIKQESKITAIELNSGGNIFVSGSENGEIYLWSSHTGELIGESVKYDSCIRALAFSPDDKILMTVTDNWIHQAYLVRNTLNPKASRRIPDSWSGVFCCWDTISDQVRVGIRVSSKNVKVINLRFDIPDAPPIPIEVEDGPGKLLKEWQEKLGLKLDEETGEIEPLYPPLELPKERLGEDIVRSRK